MATLRAAGAASIGTTPRQPCPIACAPACPGRLTPVLRRPGTASQPRTAGGADADSLLIFGHVCSHACASKVADSVPELIRRRAEPCAVEARRRLSGESSPPYFLSKPCVRGALITPLATRESRDSGENVDEGDALEAREPPLGSWLERHQAACPLGRRATLEAQIASPRPKVPVVRDCVGSLMRERDLPRKRCLPRPVSFDR